jgi:hypothetical protein
VHREAVDVLLDRDGGDDLLRVDVLGHGHLHQDAVDAGVGIERGDAGQQVGFGQAGVVLLHHRAQAVVLAGLDLVAHIDRAGRVLTDQDHGQAGLSAFGGERRGARGDLGADLGAEGDAVDDLGGHVDVPRNKKAAWGGLRV